MADLSREQSLHSAGQPEVREVKARLSPEPGQGRGPMSEERKARLSPEKRVLEAELEEMRPAGLQPQETVAVHQSLPLAADLLRG